MASTSRALPSKALRVLLWWPIVALWRIVTYIGNALGILLTLIVGVVFIGIGVLLSSTFIGLFIGIPFFVLGVLLLARALY